MKSRRWLSVLLALLLALGGLTAFAEATGSDGDASTAVQETVDAPVEEIELVLGGTSPDEVPAEGQDAGGAVAEPPKDAGDEPLPPEGQEDPAPAGPLASLTLPRKMTIGLGEWVLLAPEPVPADAVYSLTYKTGKKAVVAVNAASGEITGKKTGSADITVVADNGVKATVKVTVVKGPKNVTLSAPQKVGVGDRFSCRVTYTAKTAGSYTLTSDDEGVLRVEEDGTVTALAEGAATLTATCYNGKHGSAKVEVLPAATNLWLDRGEATMGKGDKLRLTAGMPEGQAGLLSYASSDSAVATVSADGVVSCVNLGTAVITVRNSGGLEDQCAVEVLPAPKALTLSARSITLGVGQEVQLGVTLQPEGAVGTLTFKSSKGSVAAVSQDGTITARKKDTTTITVKAHNGVSAKMKVTVKAAPKSVSVSLDYPWLTVGDATFARAALPRNTAGSVTFESDNPDVIDVTGKGDVIATGEGTAHVIATAYNGATGKVAVTVRPRIDPEVSGLLEVTFMNIGRNDGILIHCGGEWAFVDSGMHQQGVTAVKYMRTQGVDRLKYYIGTHAHRDHVGGAPYIMANIPTGQVIIPHRKVGSQIRKFATNSTEKKAVNAVSYHVVTRGEKFYIGGAECLVLGPVKVTNCAPGSMAENGNSLVLRVTYGSNTFLLTGDASGSEITKIQRADPGCMRAQVYKNAHHYGTQKYAASLCHPQITIFSTSNKKQPAYSFISYLKKMGSKVYITSSNRNGHVRIISDGTKLTVQTQR